MSYPKKHRGRRKQWTKNKTININSIKSKMYGVIPKTLREEDIK